jgi:hypothetical protein
VRDYVTNNTGIKRKNGHKYTVYNISVTDAGEHGACFVWK